MTLSETHSAGETLVEQELQARDFHPDPDALLDESKAATLLDVSPRALQAWRRLGPAADTSGRVLPAERDTLNWTESALSSQAPSSISPVPDLGASPAPKAVRERWLGEVAEWSIAHAWKAAVRFA